MCARLDVSLTIHVYKPTLFYILKHLLFSMVFRQFFTFFGLFKLLFLFLLQTIKVYYNRLHRLQFSKSGFRWTDLLECALLSDLLDYFSYIYLYFKKLCESNDQKLDLDICSDSCKKTVLINIDCLV